MEHDPGKSHHGPFGGVLNMFVAGVPAIVLVLVYTVCCVVLQPELICDVCEYMSLTGMRTMYTRV